MLKKKKNKEGNDIKGGKNRKKKFLTQRTDGKKKIFG